MIGVERAAFGVGLLGLLAAASGWMLGAPARGAWLAALVFFAGWPLGSMALLLIHALTGGRWGDALRPALLAGLCTLPLLLPAAVLLAVSLPGTYGWAQPFAHPANGFYLNVPFFIVRGWVYLAAWFALAAFILRGSAARVAGPGLFLLAVTVSFAAIDSTMSLDPRFNSSIYGMMTGSGMVLLALSMGILLAAGTADDGLRADLAKLLLASVVLWIYLDFMQLLIVWQSDLSREAPWYLARSRGAWGAVRIAVVAGHFVLPMVLLISPRLQRSRRVIAGVAGLLVAMEMLRSWWTVLPAFHRFISWVDLACMAGLGGMALGTALWAMRGPRFAYLARHA